MAECKDCARYVPNEKYDPKRLLSAVGYCRIPVRDTGGLMGTVEVGETLNITFARGPFRCRDGTRWFEPKPDIAGVAQSHGKTLSRHTHAAPQVDAATCADLMRAAAYLSPPGDSAVLEAGEADRIAGVLRKLAGQA